MVNGVSPAEYCALREEKSSTPKGKQKQEKIYDIWDHDILEMKP